MKDGSNSSINKDSKNKKKEMAIIEKKKFLFASIFIEANKLQTAFDQSGGEVSSKQWLLLVIVHTFKEPPTLSAVGEIMGCSRQNVKKIAVILEKKGYIILNNNYLDKRSLCIEITPKFVELAIKMDQSTEKVLDCLFEDFSEQQLDKYYKSVSKISTGIEKLGRYFEENKI